MSIEVTFGRKVHKVQPQRVGRIRRKLPEAMSLVRTATGGEAPADVGEQLYEGLKVFVPDIAPLWEIMGYASESEYNQRNDEGFEESPYDPDVDGSPTTEEIGDLINAIYVINGGERLVNTLKKVVTPELISRQLRVFQARTILTAAEDSKDSPSSPPQSGGSDLPSSSIPAPTSTPTTA